MDYKEASTKAIETINELFLLEMKKNFPSELFETYKEILMKMVNKELTPICTDIMKKNEAKLKDKLEEINKLELNKEEKQIKFNEELNSLFNFLGKAKMMQKALIVQKNGINFIKFNEGQFSEKIKKRQKEIKIFEKLKKQYEID